MLARSNIQGVPKNDQTCFCQNFAKSASNLIIFGTQIAKTMELCNVHSLSTSYNYLCQRTGKSSTISNIKEVNKTLNVAAYMATVR